MYVCVYACMYYMYCENHHNFRLGSLTDTLQICFFTCFHFASFVMSRASESLASSCVGPTKKSKLQPLYSRIHRNCRVQMEDSPGTDGAGNISMMVFA